MKRGLFGAAVALVFGAAPSHAAVTDGVAQHARPTQAAKHNTRNVARPIFRNTAERAAFASTLEAVIEATHAPGAPRVCAKDRKRLQRLVDVVRHDQFFDRRAA